MYRELLAHREYVTQKIAEDLSKDERKQLYKYHVKRVRDFQHERLIHLIVTLFFTLLFLGACLALMSFATMLLFWPLTGLVLILSILEVAYIHHYYQLENGVQSLYKLTEKLGKLQ